jgi:uncharacterized protein
MTIQKEEGRAVIYREDGFMLAECDYTEDKDTLTITHTFVDDSLRGQGLAAKLVETVLGVAKEKNKAVKATCSYARSYLAKHPQA